MSSNISAIALSKRKHREPNLYLGGVNKKIGGLITIILVLTVLLPLIFIVTVSFKNNNEFYTNIWGIPEVWRIENYATAWEQGKIGMFALNSVVVTSTAVLGSVVLPALAGYALSKMYIPFSEAIIGLLMGLNFVPGVAVHISLFSQMNAMGFSKTLWMMILPYMAWQIPFSTFIYKKFFDSISQEILEAARVDGSSEVYTFLQIVLPLVTPATATVVVFNFISIWGEYLWASICCSSSVRTQTLPVGLVNFKGEYGIEWGPFAAAIVIIVTPLICVFTYFQKYFIQGLTAGAVKG